MLPFFALAALELALRVGGYGYCTDFFQRLRIGDQSFLVENATFGYRFFPREIAREPLSLRVPAKKMAGTYRIFILGESAAMGDPEPAFGAGRFLEVLLNERFPQANFEVVNTAMTAINSHAILPIACECARHEGDLWILYIGNNEMVGPFGAATVFGPKAPPLPLIRLYLVSQTLRVGQLALDLKRKFKAGSPRETWEGMEMFLGNQVAPDAPAREAVYHNFDRNLSDIVRAGLGSGAKVLLSTVAVNLRDSPPFGSLHGVDISPADQSACDTNLQAGRLAAKDGKLADATRCFEQAAKGDSHLAELQYQWGQTLLKLGDTNTAAAHFQMACDVDALPFRATSRINKIIQVTGRKFAGPNLDCFDAVSALQTNAPEGILGQETFYEHVHYNFDGNYRLARAWAGEVEKSLPVSLHHGAIAEWASQNQCEQRLAVSDWDRCNAVEEMVGRRQRPPLNAQPNNAESMRVLTEQVSGFKRSMASVTVRSNAQNVYVAALRRSPDDYFILANHAEFLQRTGANQSAVEQWQHVRERFPQVYAPYYQLGRLAAAQGQADRAERWLAQTVAMRPSFAPGWFELGSVRAANSNFSSAITAFDQALRFDPKNSEYCFYDALALVTVGQRSEAIERQRQAVRFDPGNWKAHFELGRLMGQDGNMTEAKAECEAVIRLNPDFPFAHLNLGLALSKLGDLEGAKYQFEETLRLDPGNSHVAECLAQVQAFQMHKNSEPRSKP